MKIIGIGGKPRSGKDTLAELFIKDSYFGVSFGDIVRGFAYERHKGKPDPISVAHLTETANWLRQTRGSDVILQEALQAYEKAQSDGGQYSGLVLWSVRAPVEVDWILTHRGELIWMEADAAVRHNRWLSNLRDGEMPISLDEFKHQEMLQWKPQPGLPDSVQMNLAYVQAKATRTFENNGDNYDDFLLRANALIEAVETIGS